jgi:diaminohydroxyphosphoribosylaminopyrimidine deaminase/5-amino-6-(5-phosphoribosylamino)uracil reductase
MNTDELFMRRAIHLARQGSGYVAPNPMVGAVIVHDGVIIGEGYHEFFGGPHAEVNAVAKVSDQSLLSEATLFVTLEPCSHFGKTPPCADLICQNNFKRVVIGTKDPNPLVSGRGVDQLINNGIDTVVGILEDECIEMNRHFIQAQLNKKPFVLLKWAQSSNGYMDNGGTPIRISNSASDHIVHQRRHDYQAILVGKNTVLNDDPLLTTRLDNGKNAVRVILDRQCSLPSNRNIFTDDNETIVLNEVKDERIDKVRFVKVSEMEPNTLLSTLFDLGIISVLVEGGRQTLESFINAGLWDRALVIQNAREIKVGTKAPVISHLPIATERFEDDIHFHFKNK